MDTSVKVQSGSVVRRIFKTIADRPAETVDLGAMKEV
jgi:hypothetical protein